MVQKENINKRFLAETEETTKNNKILVNRYYNDEDDGSFLWNYWEPCLVSKCIGTYGAENIYYVLNDKYYNNITGQYFYNDTNNNWHKLTHVGELPSLYEAYQNNALDLDVLYATIHDEYFNKINNINISSKKIEDFIDCHFKVEVKGGRKWQGEGYLVSLINVANYYGYGSTKIAKVYDPKTNRIESVTAKYINYIDNINIFEFFEEYKLAMLAKIDKTNKNDLIIDIDNVVSLDFDQPEFVEWMKEKYGNNIDLANAYDVVEEEKKAKFQAFMESKMPSIIEWVKKNTDKTEEEDILGLAKHIFNKHYNNN